LKFRSRKKQTSNLDYNAEVSQITQSTEEKMKIRKHIALFAGLGGFIAAANRAGFQTVYANDNNPHCYNTLKTTYPEIQVTNHSITELSAKTELAFQDEIDVLSAGFPCQSFSAAGDNLGFEDPRGKLFFDIVRLCQEAASPPKILLLENVAYLKQFNNGSRLSIILQHLRAAGYWVSEKHAMVLNSKEICGSPQNRERLYIVAYHSKFFKKNYFESVLEPEITETRLWDIINQKKKQDSRYYLEKESKYWDLVNDQVKTNGKKRLYQLRRTWVRTCPEGVCPTQTANKGGGGHNTPFVADNYGIRKLTEEECLALQGYDPTEVCFPIDAPTSVRYSMIGNAIYPKVAEMIFNQIDFSKIKKVKNDKLELSA